MRAAKRDANEREMIEAWRALGALWIPQPPSAGFDGILLFRGQVHFLEIKEIKPGRAKYYLTDNERRMCQEIERRGASYEIICNMQQALELVEAG